MNTGMAWVWTVVDGEWKPFREFETVALAQTAARELAAHFSVAVQANGQWVLFDETGTQTLGSESGPGSQYSSPRRTKRHSAASLRRPPTIRLDGLLAKLVDVSEDGMQIIVPKRRRFRTADVVRFELVDREARIEVRGRVAWTKPGRVGLEILWDSMPTVTRTYIRQLTLQIKRREERSA